MRPVSLVLAVALAGCGAPATDDFSDLAGLDQKADAFSKRMKVLGQLAYGDTSATVTYTGTPRYQAYTFEGHEGDEVTATLYSDLNDPTGWLLDSKFHVLGRTDDEWSISITLPKNDTYYVVYRSEDLKKGRYS